MPLSVLPEFDPIRPTQAYLDFGRRLREARHAQELEQADMRALVGLHPTIISQIENGRRRCNVFELHAFARAYQRPMEWFVTGAQVIPAGRPVELDTSVSALAEALMGLPEEARAHLLRQVWALVDVERKAAI